jgi:hypothetical protein
VSWLGSPRRAKRKSGVQRAGGIVVTVFSRELGESIERSHPIVPEETEREARCCNIGRSGSELHARQTGSTSSSVKGDGISLAS